LNIPPSTCGEEMSAICRDSAAYAIVINSYGEMLDSVKLPTLTKGGTARVNPDDIEKIVQLFRDKKPHVVAISSENRRAVDIKDALNRTFCLHFFAHNALA
jgi:hypothetical protein